MESSILWALSGNNSVAGRGKLGEKYIRALSQALATNQDIEDLDLSPKIRDRTTAKPSTTSSKHNGNSLKQQLIHH
jgi:hypothetical protein